MRMLFAMFSALWLSALQASPVVLLDGFEQESEYWRQVGDCKALLGIPRSGELSLRCQAGSSVLFSKQAHSEMGVLELWVRPGSIATAYRIQVLVAEQPSLNALWQPVALIEYNGGDTSYQAHRVSIDEPAKRYLQLDIQRQYLEYANALHSGIALALAGSERNKMSNPMAYASFRNIINDTKRVTTPLQQARLNSMLKPFGDLVTATLNVVSAGTYSAFAEPFKSFLASSFDKSNYSDAGLSRKNHAQKARNYLQQSKESFNKAYL